MGDRIIGVAVVGMGEVALNTHLPTLMLCSHMFRTVAVVDLSRQATEHAAAKFRVKRTYVTFDSMIEDSDDIDLVMLMNANEFHTVHTIKSLRAGKHVFVEKPMALSLESADEVIRAQKETGKIVFVGQMRRYATAFLRVKEIVEKQRQNIKYVNVRDIIGHNAFFVEESGSFPLRFTDVPHAKHEEREQLWEDMLVQAIGDKANNPLDSATWALLTGLSSHDLGAMRDLLGMPKGVLSASRSPAADFLWVMFDYEGFVAYYEIGIDEVKLFDCHIEVYLGNSRVRVNFDTPYVKGLPITTTINRTKRNGDHVEEHIRPTYEDAFTLEYKQLYAAIVHGKPHKTTPADSRDDIVMFKMIMDAMR